MTFDSFGLEIRETTGKSCSARSKSMKLAEIPVVLDQKSMNLPEIPENIHETTRPSCSLGSEIHEITANSCSSLVRIGSKLVWTWQRQITNREPPQNQFK